MIQYDIQLCFQVISDDRNCTSEWSEMEILLGGGGGGERQSDIYKIFVIKHRNRGDELLVFRG